MLLTKVTLKNYGVYRDENVFDFSCTPEKPIILVGGKNGAGKTTLFEAIILCLYGISFFDKKTSRSTYEKFLANKIHRFLGTPIAADHASIIVDFKFYHDNTIQEYSVDRTWKNEDGKIIEELTIKKDGSRLESVDESQWQAFIEELIPRGIAKLFFFDGEKIVRIAEEGNEDIEIKSSFGTLLGLDLVEQLHTDLKVHILRSINADSNKLQAEHDKLSKERDEHLGKIGNLDLGLIRKNEEMSQIRSEIDEFEGKISKIGGGYATKREERNTNRELYKNRLEITATNLKKLLSGLAPFCILPKQLEEVKNQLKKDEQALKKQFEKEIVKEKLEQISSALETSKFWDEFNFDTEKKEKLISKLIEVFNQSDQNDEEKILFHFSPLESANLLNTIDRINNHTLPDIKKETEAYSQIREKLDRIEIAITNTPHDDEIGPLVSKLNNLYKNMGILENEISDHEQKISTNKNYVKLLNFKLRNIIDEQFKNEDLTTQTKLAKEVQKVLDDYIEKLKIKKLQLLEKYLLNSIKQLMHKENFIEKISINKNTFEIMLYRKDDTVIPKDLLSKGEQQMYATAVLWALAKTSGKPLPFMIDTPLARLDMEHRENLIENFYASASHQVVIFSTDSEIDAAYYRKLSPFVTRSYAMHYLSDKGKTLKNDGYFWNENGERIIAV